MSAKVWCRSTSKIVPIEIGCPLACMDVSVHAQALTTVMVWNSPGEHPGIKREVLTLCRVEGRLGYHLFSFRDVR